MSQNGNKIEIKLDSLRNNTYFHVVTFCITAEEGRAPILKSSDFFISNYYILTCSFGGSSPS